MNSQEIPDDVWIEIFENVADPSQLARLVRTCRRFKALAMRPFLRNIHWGQMQSTTKNLQAWNTVYRDLAPLVRKISLTIAFEFNPSRPTGLSPDMTLYDLFHQTLPSFTSLNELVFDGTVISPYTYMILSMLPSLRSLTISNCKYIPVATSFAERQTYILDAHSPEPEFAFGSLAITHLALHKITMPQEQEHYSTHPLLLSTTPTLTSLSITWNSNNALTYSAQKWQSLGLRHLEVVMPHLTRDLIDSLVQFVLRCPLGPRISLCIERHSLSDQQINSLHFPLKGVWSYTGPLPIASFSSVKKNPQAALALTHLVMNEPMELGSLIECLESLPHHLEALEVQVRKWDVELLFAIRSLFPIIRSLVVRYGKGVLPSNFLETLGSNILFDLPKLHTFKIVYDEACTITTRQLAGFHHAYLFTQQVVPHPEDEEVDADAESQLPYFECNELKDYLMGWNRYCKCLRQVQLNTTTYWERRFEGDDWTERLSSV